ncbi:MAG: polysaccharide biosynthesis protein [Clostridiales Family XIII bacterium]|jgi:stage V sporulation protein B|nr:polysaccharide biosynthesis protein [Clostridiales Family XIII bacterium]
MSKKSFLTGAAILGAAGLLVQVMGAIFRIPLANIIGEVGMGYFQTAYPVYIFLLVFSTNGAPAAISKMTSERIATGDYDDAHRVFKLAFIVMLIFGVFAAAGIAALAGPISTAVKSEGSYYSLLAIAPALLFVPIMSVFRGYFQGMQEMRPTALSQLTEQAVRVAIGLGLAVLLMPSSQEAASAGACVGASIGPVAGVIMLAAVYFKKRKSILENVRNAGRQRHREKGRKKHRERAGGIFTELVTLTIPTTVGISILPIMNLADMALCRVRLIDSGFAASEAEGLYGLMAGFAAPIINLPMALALSIALSMIPAVAAAGSTNDKLFINENISMGLRTAMIVGTPCSFGLIVLAEPIMRLIYPAFREEAGSAAMCLMILAAGVIFLCVAQTMVGILQGMSRAGLPVLSLLVGVAVKTVLTYGLTGITALNINGATIGSTVGYAVICFMNVMFVKRITGVKFDVGLAVMKPLISGIVMSLAVVAVYFICSMALSLNLSALPAICAGAVVYVLMILKTKAIQPHEIKRLPKGDRVLSILEKLRLA